MEKVTFGDNLPGYVCGDPTRPGVVVVQEWWGVTETIQAHALRISREGYRVLVPDLYKGALGVNVEEAHHLMSNLDWDAATGTTTTRERAIAVTRATIHTPEKLTTRPRLFFPTFSVEISAAVSHLRSTGSAKGGIVGFCMGGALSLIAAKACGVDCACAFYGVPDVAKCDPATLAVPVLGHFGALDALEGFSDAKTAKRLADALRKSPRAEDSAVHMYDRVGHAFANESPAPHASFEAREETQGFPVYDADAAATAWARTFAFFEKHLGKE